MTLLTELAVHFGPYRIYPQQRLVLDADRPVRLGSRAMDILLILIENAGDMVSKQQLMAHVWPRSVVEDGNLRVHMAALRKALGDGQSGQRYIVTVAQRGYSFVAPITLQRVEHRPNANMNTSTSHNLPTRQSRILGRDALVNRLASQLQQHRFISLTGPGGIGKTTVALRVAEQLIGHYRDGIRLMDLAPITDPAMITTHLAMLLDIAAHDDEPMNRIGAFLRDRQMLLVIDNCEHMVDAIALLSEGILRNAPDVHILITSRESLQIDGEFVERLEPLDCPPAAGKSLAEAMRFAALQLFVERATANQEHFELTEANLQLAIEICQRLDGIPLAIELAAAQVGNLGFSNLLEHLQASFLLHGQNHQGALARHQTLRATLDWSFQMLSTSEQICLQRLSLFKGRFSLESAMAVVTDPEITAPEVFATLPQLVTKSLLNVEFVDEDVLYYLLDTTRSYALEKLRHSEQLPAIRERHAQRCLAIMQQAHSDWEQIPTHKWIERYIHSLEDIRAALDWGLDNWHAQKLVIELIAYCTPLWQELSLLKEHGFYVRKALKLLEADPFPSPKLLISLKLALGSVSYHTHSNISETMDAFVTAQALAEQTHDVAGQLRAISGQMTVNLCQGQYKEALEKNRQFNRLGMRTDLITCLSTHRLRVLALHFSGDQTLARQNADRVIQRLAQSGHLNRFTYGFGVQYDQSVAALTIQARILWLQGRPELAWQTARQALEIALQINHGTSICHTLSLAGCAIALYNGNTETASELLKLLREQSQRHSALLFYDWGQHYAQLMASPDTDINFADSDGIIRDIMLTLRQGQIDDALFERAQSGAAGWCTSEILRARADSLPPQEADEAEAILHKALKVAKKQGALAWELRSATSLARLKQRQGHERQAYDVLEAVHARFTEGFATPDLIAARRLLDQLQ
ncbi:winged helix-turn-helix domain-containing protein [Pseudomonas sp. KFB-139]|uniref:Winged helix-turn-helix domain-containing protein n=1 Tax=Pseudomonas serbiensis TaxID=3064350 RepID=A0ABT9CP02_9PSED|nr:winged helix-turn-helix domain-containing protein [Pseudomonas sp. KFB-138]MDO7926568.1 winged helix-turn-helix domain-containing protein [Pseudomonas sp. KFB-138]